MKTRGFLLLFVFAFFACLAFAVPAEAVEYRSNNFVVKDPVLGAIGGSGSSASFDMFSSGEFIVTGRSGAPSYTGRFGFLYFPFVTAPTLTGGSATDTTVDLSWSASTSGLGFSVSGYEIGQSTTSGGPYSFTNVGNILLSTRTGLTSGTTYYFVVRTLDAFGSPIITSNEFSIATTGTTPSAGGGGSSGNVVATGVSFTGEAYPGATVVFLKNGIERARTRANEFGIFQMTLEELFDQTVLYTLYAQDLDGRRSLLLNYPLFITRGVTTGISGIRFAPTLIADKLTVKKGEEIIFSGFALPSKTIQLTFRDGGPSTVLSALSLGNGRYRYPLSTRSIPKDDYEIRPQYEGDTRVGNVIEFMVGDVTVFRDASQNKLPGDCNMDKVINLRDFSVLAFWYQKENPPACIDANNDKIINLVDFSILAFYWSG